MSTKGSRDYRPAMHYTPPQGWINDPNGLCFDGETFHIFAQHYPHDTKWGPMHWRHAVAQDLLHWKDVGIALPPDELGMIFSGSAIADRENAAGFGKNALIAMFTHHGDAERQSIAYAPDGIHFTKYPSNPVIENPGIPDFRDPKLMKNPVLDGFIALVAAGDRILFYRSEDIIHWTQTGEFGSRENRMGGVFECPDMLAMRRPDGSNIYVLTASMTGDAETGGSRTQYFIGDFDGCVFHETEQAETPLLLDAGYDNYAAVAFNGVARPVMMGWAMSWTYAADTPTGEYCGALTLAKWMSLAETPHGLRLAARPVLPFQREVSRGKSGMLPGETFTMDICADGAFEAKIFNDAGEEFRFGLSQEGVFFTDRSHAGESAFNAYFQSPVYQKTSARRLYEGQVEMRLVFDRSIAELFADGGVYACTAVMYPTKPYVRFAVQGGIAKVSMPEEGGSRE